jgi:hypothetical protein
MNVFILKHFVHVLNLQRKKLKFTYLLSKIPMYEL